MTDIDAETLARSMLDEALRLEQPIILSEPLAAFARAHGYVEFVHFVTSKDLKGWPERAGLERGVINGPRFWR